MKSIKHYLMAWLSLSMAVVMFIAAVYSYLASVHEIDEVFDAQLAQYARLIAGYNHNRQAILSPDHEELRYTLGHKYENKISYQIWSTSESLLGKSESADLIPLGPFAPGFHTTTGHDGKTWQVFVLQDKQEQRWYMTAESAEIRKELVTAMARTAIFPLVTGIILMLVLVWIILLRGLSPLQQIASAITRRRAEDLTPMVFTSVPQEASVLVDNINALLGRVQRSLERERRFSADAAHELKTPLAALKLHLANLQYEVEKNHTGSHQTLAKAQRSCNDIQRLVEQLLVFNRLEPEYFSRILQTVPLAPLCRELLSFEAELALDRRQDLRLDIQDETMAVRSDPAVLAMLIRNLVHNAIIYTQPDGSITLRMKQDGNHAVIEVNDNGPGIPANERTRVFDRFYRLGGDSHGSGTNGSGLGLAIASEIVRLHNGTIKLLDGDNDTGLCVQVVLPLS